MNEKDKIYAVESTRGTERIFKIVVPDKKSKSGSRTEFLCPVEKIAELVYFLGLGKDFSFLPADLRQNIESAQTVGSSGLSPEDYVKKIEKEAGYERSLWVGKTRRKSGALQKIPTGQLIAGRKEYKMMHVFEALGNHNLFPKDLWYHGRIVPESIDPLYIVSRKKTRELLLVQMKNNLYSISGFAEEDVELISVQALRRNPEIAGALKPLLEKREKETKH